MNSLIQSTVVGIFSCGNLDLAKLQQLSHQLNLPIVDSHPNQFPSGEFCLVLESDGSLSLHFTGRGVPGAISVDFLNGPASHRRQFGGGKGQLIAKAVGIKNSYRPHVLDLTAGLGQDGFVLASLGCDVTLVERVDLIYHLLRDGLERARFAGEPDLQSIANKMELINANAIDYLNSSHGQNTIADVIYLDPMFPEREKKAKVKKSMAAFHSLVGGDIDAGEVLERALMCARYRVVVKRPRKAMSISEQYSHLHLPAAGLILEGKSSRYDIYPLAKLPINAS